MESDPSENSNDIDPIPQKNLTLNALPGKSKEKYYLQYNLFMDWCNSKNFKKYCDSVILSYLMELSEKYKSSTLWSIHSMLKATLLAKNGVDIGKYEKVTAFLKKQSFGYVAKQSKTFTREEINKFLLEAPDEKYLMAKVLLIIGIAGACRSEELTKMSLDDVTEKNNKLIIHLPAEKSYKQRTFIVSNSDDNSVDVLSIYRKYFNLRPKNMTSRRLFIKYNSGKCFAQNVGSHMVGAIPFKIASYLNLPKSNEYSGHCFRRTAAVLLSEGYDSDQNKASDSKNDDDQTEKNVKLSTPTLSSKRNSTPQVKTLNTTASKELILDMDCDEEDITPEQMEYYKRAEKEYQEVLAKYEQLVKQNNGEVVHKGDNVIAYQYNTTGPPTLTTLQTNGPSEQSPVPTVSAGNIVIQSKPGAVPTNTLQLVMDPRLGLIVGTMTPTAGNAAPVVPITAAQKSSQPVTVSPQVRQMTPQPRKRGRPSLVPTNNPPPLQQIQQLQMQQNAPVTNQPGIRPAESTAVGGLVTGSSQKTQQIVDLTNDDGKPAADSREVSFNKLQGKTFPSLVVVARPHLHAKEAVAANDRSILDTKVKQVLVYSPTKFTEWLIQQGLVRSEQTCAVHPINKLNLGMYSDVSKFPHSGGYVWISECCPQRFVSVFNGSLFEGSNHPPTVLLKLIYHWACQTNIQNVVQWVKVDNFYVKGLFTWLRAACSISLQKNLKLMGGWDKKIEVGVISLGTTSQDGSQRQVKVEVLGILDPEQRLIRLRAVEPLADGERNYKRRFTKILEPLKQWVHTDSTIITDLTVDKGTLQLMGFQKVLQGTQSGHSGNQSVMEYLRKIVPRMFQNTLSLLSRQIIQQFLDELVWREWFGQTANQTFTNICIHLAEQTRLNTHDTLIQRLNKVGANPFKNHWFNYATASSISKNTTVIPPTLESKRYQRKRQAPILTTQEPIIIDLEKERPAPKKQHLIQIRPSPEPEQMPDMPMVPLENYYYGTLKGDPNNPLAAKVTLNVKCCVCKTPFTNNIQLLDHLLAHAHNIPSNKTTSQCRYCLAHLPSVEDLNKHIADVHPVETKSVNNPHLACVICEVRFLSVYMLGKHMSKDHVPLELPYQCGTCGFRTSSHRQVVDHFYKEHNGATTVQCPFCLKSTTVWSAGRIMSTNVTFFLAHLQKHQKKGMVKKCHKCALWFIHKDVLKDHLAKAHDTLVNTRHCTPWPLPSNYSMVPKSKTYETSLAMSPLPPASPEAVVHNIVLDIPFGTVCIECNKDIETADHYPEKLNCNTCRFVTDCTFALNIHQEKCSKSPGVVLPRLGLEGKLHCVCGYCSNDGNMIAKHLALCERKTAYPTAEMASAVTESHSMLDVLGLVRKNGDSIQTTPSPPPVDEDAANATVDDSKPDDAIEITEETKEKPEEKSEERPEEKSEEKPETSETETN